jgi:hypothetical protein
MPRSRFLLNGFHPHTKGQVLEEPVSRGEVITLQRYGRIDLINHSGKNTPYKYKTLTNEAPLNFSALDRIRHMQDGKFIGTHQAVGRNKFDAITKRTASTPPPELM